VKFYILGIALYDAESWTLRKIDQKWLERFEVWCWRMTGKIIWTDRVKIEVLHSVEGREEHPTYNKTKEG
jgi:hypothetical protein